MSTSNYVRIFGRGFGVSKGITKESHKASGPRKFTFWLGLLTALLSFGAGIFWLQVTRTQRTTNLDQARFAAENVQGTVGLDEAIQAISIRH
jgi:hypothetical protein